LAFTNKVITKYKVNMSSTISLSLKLKQRSTTTKIVGANDEDAQTLTKVRKTFLIRLIYLGNRNNLQNIM
jgi:hypothetical protein